MLPICAGVSGMIGGQTLVTATIECSPENIMTNVAFPLAPQLRVTDCNIVDAVNCGDGKPPAEKIMTDGCGYISGAALTAIMRVMKYSVD